MPLPPGSTSAIRLVFIQDSTSTTGGGKSGLAFNTSGLTCYYVRDTDSGSTAVTLATMTLGTWATSGFKEVDATNQPGLYQFGIPNAAIAAGASEVAFYFQGASGMAAVVLGIDIGTTAVNVTQWNGANVASPNVAGVPLVDVGRILGTVSAGTAGYVGPDWGHVNAPTTSVGLTGTTISSSQVVASVSGAVGSVTAAVTANTTQLAGQTVTAAAGVTFPTSVASPTNITAGTITTVTNLTNLPAITTDWLTGTGVAASAVTKIQAGLSTYAGGAVASVTGNVGGNVVGSVGSVTGLTNTTIASAVWTDTTAGDFTTLASPGKIIFAQLGGTFTSTSSSVFSTASLANAPTGGTAPTAAAVANAVWQDATSGDFTVSGSIGKSLFTSGLVPGAAGGLFIAGTNAATTITTSLTTHIVGTVDTATNLTNLPTAPTDWLTAAAVKADAVTKIQAGLSTYSGGAVASVTGSVGSVTSPVTVGTINTDAVSAAAVSAAAVAKIQSGLSTYAGGDTSGTTTLLARLTTARAGYLDQLGGAFTGSTSVFTAAALANSPGAGSDPWLTDLSAKTIDGTYSGYQAGALAAYSLLPEGTIASATATTLTLPATDARGVAIADDGSYANTALYILAGTGRRQTVVLDTPTGVARQYEVVTGTMPTQLDSTSRYVLSGIKGNAWTADGWIASATATTLTLPALNSSGLDIPDDGRYAETMIRIVAGRGAGQVPVLTTSTGVPREYRLLDGSCPVQLDITSQYQYGPSTVAELDLRQGVPTVNDPETVGDALNAARADGFGKWVMTGTAPATVTLYAADGTTVVKTFTVDNAAAPTSRS